MEMGYLSCRWECSLDSKCKLYQEYDKLGRKSAICSVCVNSKQKIMDKYKFIDNLLMTFTI